MVKIAFKQDDDGNITDFAEYPSSLNQDTNKGWIVVEGDPAFSISDKFLWTIRPSDNVLVHKSTNMTPAEETRQALALLGANGGQALADSATAKIAADKANTIANGAVESMAQLGKVVANLLAAQSAPETTTTTDDGGTK